MLNMEETKQDVINRKGRLLNRQNKKFDKVLSDEQKEDFLQLIASGYNITSAANFFKIAVGTIQSAKHDDQDFNKALEGAMAEQADLIEQVALERALKGVDKPVWFKGEQVGTDIQHDNNLLITMLKAAKPEKYKERKEVTGSGTIELQLIDYTGGTSANVKTNPGSGDAQTLLEDQEPSVLGEDGKDSEELPED